MNEEQLLALLESRDYDKVSHALIYIEKNLKERPSPRLSSKLVELCLNTDSDIKAEAVRAAGFYWQLPEVYPILVDILTNVGEDDVVLNAALYAISQMAQNQAELMNRSIKLLACVALNEVMPEMERKSAYCLALLASGRISANVFAKMSVQSDVMIDKELMLQLSNNPDPVLFIPSARPV